jgi:hypothetical protein
MRAFCYCDGFFRLHLPSDSARRGKIHERVQASRVRELCPIEGKFLSTEIALFRSVLIFVTRRREILSDGKYNGERFRASGVYGACDEG